MKTAYLQWITLPVSISCYCFVCTQANSGSVYCLQYPVLFPDDCMAGGGEIIFCIAAEQEKIAAM